jgi:hypothetical protein
MRCGFAAQRIRDGGRFRIGHLKADCDAERLGSFLAQTTAVERGSLFQQRDGLGRDKGAFQQSPWGCDGPFRLGPPPLAAAV